VKPSAGLRLILLLALVLLPAWRALGASDPWQVLEQQWFDTVDMADGLPHSVTTALAQDRSGVLWIGTMGGLVRYDGYRTQVFDTADTARGGLPDTYVRCLLELPDGSLLVGTNAGGLARFDPRSGRFRSYPIGRGGTSNRKIYALAADGDRGAWIATDHGLDHLDIASDRIAPVATGPEADPRHFAVYQDRAGNLWLGNNKGLFERRAGRHDFVRQTAANDAVERVLHDEIWALREDAEGRLWVGSVQMGAAWRDRDGSWHAVPGYTVPAGAPRLATVRDFAEVAPGQIWMATDGRGILRYAPGAGAGAGALRPLTHDLSQPSSLPGNAVRALLLDRAGNVWAATDLGAGRSNARPSIAFALRPSLDAAHSPAAPNVRSILVDARQRIWLGETAGRIDVIDLAAGDVRHLQLAGRQSQRDVQSLAEAPDGTIWVGTQGVAQIDPATFAIRTDTWPALDDSPVLNMLRDGPYMLVGTYNGVYRCDTRNGRVAHFQHDAQPDSLAYNTVHQVARIGQSVWYATNNGISIARDALQTTGFTNLARREGDPASLPQNRVNAIAADARGRVWVASFGGVGLLENGDSPPYRFRNFGMAQGMASDKTNAVLPGDRGNLWVSTANGITMIDGRSLHVYNLGSRDGQRITSFINASAARMADGTLLFGGLDGLAVIRPLGRIADHPAAPLRITNAVVNGRTLPFGRLPGDHGTLALGPHERNLRLDFALLDFQAPQETDYSYRLDGLDDAWVDVPRDSSPSAVYTNLPHGHYALHLRAVPRGLHAEATQSTLAINVAPLWYETLWARLAAVLLLAGLVAVLVHLRTIYLRRRALELQTQIEEHTRELRAANRRLDLLAGTDELTGISNRRRFLEQAEAIRRDGESPVACMALLDLDHFKRVNDTHGHLAGDAVLRSAAGVICQHLRTGDLVGRYGGEELVICLPGADAEQAMAVAERIRTSLRATRIWHEGQALHITASFGIAPLQPGESMASWLSRADAALYESKRRGRDCCTVAG
jgi:diguanylate cyclase (GGDEF)-like protein